MATIYVKFNIETEEIPYTNTSGLPSSVNFTDYQQSILGSTYDVGYWPDAIEVGTTNNYVEVPLIETNLGGLNPNVLNAFQVTNGGDAYEYVAQGAVATGAVTTDPSVANANAPTTTETFGALTFTWPDYVWVPFQVETSLFTSGADVVDFNNLLPGQQSAIIQAGQNVSNTYDGLGGNDVVTLPDKANYDVSLGVGTGYTLGWNDSTQFYTDSKAGDRYTVYGGTGSYNIHLGAGTDSVAISGSNLLAANGNSTIYGNTDNNNITIIGSGNNNIIEGTGDSTVSLYGNGDNTITMSSGDVTVNLTGTGELDVSFTGNDEDLELDNISGFSGKIVISGFNDQDKIDFADQPDLTTSAEFGSPGELDVYNNTTTAPLVAKLVFAGASKAFAESLEPKDIGGGTEIGVDTSNVSLTDPSGISASGWTFIHKWEGPGGHNVLAPYQGASDISGMTVGLGVDFGGGLITTQDLSAAFGANYASDANLAFLATGIGKTGNASLTNLEMRKWQTTSVGPQSTAVSITASQANALDSTAETKTYNELVKAYGSKWGTVPDAARAVLMDMDYNFGLPKLRSFDFWGEVVAQDWNAAAEELQDWGGPQNLLDRRETDYNELMTIPQLKGKPPVSVENETSASTVLNVASYNFTVNPSSQYAIDPSGTSTYILKSNPTSPNFATITLPATDASEYSYSFFKGSSWSSPQTAQPLETVSVPLGVEAISVTLLDHNGNVLTGANPFTFYMTFASAGAFSGTVTSPSSTSLTFDLTKAVDTIDGGPENNTIIATSNTATAGDQIDGGSGSNTMALEGPGTFNLAFPTTLTNIQTITAAEGQAAYSGGGQAFAAQNQIVVLRTGLNATVNVESDASLNANDPKPATITIVGAANTDVINLASGNDVVTVGKGETVNLGAGNDTIIINSATIGATIGNGTGQNTLDVTGGGTMAMGANITDITDVLLSPASAAYHFTANTISGLTISDRSTTTADSLSAGGAHQTLTGGGAGSVDFVGAAAGDDAFKDTAALFNHDTVAGFGDNGDVIDLPDVSLAGLKPLGYVQNTSSSGTLTVSDGVHTAAITLLGQYLANAFHPGPDAGLGTAITYQPASPETTLAASQHV